MVKIILFSLFYCSTIFVMNFNNDVDGLRSSISESVSSGSWIKNGKSFFPKREKRASTYLVPYEDSRESESSEEHHKSKRCWKARPVQKIRLNLDSKETTTDNDYYKETKSSKGIRKNFNDLYDNKKRSTDSEYFKNEEENYSSRNIPVYKIVPLENLRPNFNQFSGLNLYDRSKEEKFEDLKLMKIKNQLKSDDYNVWALVGKRAGHPEGGNKENYKFICYCKEAGDCSGINCEKSIITDKYNPCSTCRYIGPSNFVGNTKNGCESYKKIYQTNSEQLSSSSPLKVQYPDTKNDFIKLPMKNSEAYYKDQRHLQFSYDNPKIVLANTKDNVRPGEQYRILQIPVYRMGNQNSGLKSGTNFYDQSPRVLNTNEYKSGNIKWGENSYYPIIGGTRNHRIDSQNFGYPYQNYNRFIGSTIPVYNQQRVVDGSYQQPGIPESTNLFYNNKQRNGFNPNIINSGAYPQPQQSQTSLKNSEFTGKTNSWIEDNEKEKSFQYDLKTEGQGVREKFNPESLENLEKYVGHDSGEIVSENSSYEDKIKDIEDEDWSKEGIHRNVYNAGDYKTKADNFGVIDEPEKYEFPIIYSKTLNSYEANDYSHKLKEDKELGTNNYHADFTGSPVLGIQESDNEDLFTTLSNHDDDNNEQLNQRTFTENPNYYHQTSDYSNEEIILKDQLENLEDYNVDETRTELIDNQKNNYDHHSSDGYFNSETYAGFGEGRDDVIPVTGSRTNYDFGPEEENTSFSISSNEEPELRSENIDAKTYDDENRTFGSSKDFDTVTSNFDKPLIASENQFLDDDDDDDETKLIALTDTSISADEFISPKTTSIPDSNESGNFENSYEKGYSILPNAESDNKNSEGILREVKTSEEELRKDDDDYFPSSSSSDGKNIETQSQIEPINSLSSSEDDGSYSDDSYLEENNPVTFGEKNDETSADGRLGIVENKNQPADNIQIENTPTRYYSPNDIVLDYIKKNSNNPVVGLNNDNHDDDDDNNKEIISKYPTATGEEIHHKENDADPGSYYDSMDEESKEIVVQTSRDNHKFDVDDDQEILVEKVEPTKSDDVSHYPEEKKINSKEFEHEVNLGRVFKDSENSEEPIYYSSEERYDTDDNKSEDEFKGIEEPVQKSIEDHSEKDSSEYSEERIKPVEVLESIKNPDDSDQRNADPEMSGYSKELKNEYYNNEEGHSPSEIPEELIATRHDSGEAEDGFQLVKNSKELKTDSKHQISRELEDFTKSSVSVQSIEGNDEEILSLTNDKSSQDNNNEKLTAESYYDKILKGEFLGSSHEDANNPIYSLRNENPPVNQFVGIKNEFENTEPNDVEDISEQSLKHGVEFKEENYSNEPDVNLVQQVESAEELNPAEPKVDKAKENISDEIKSIEFVGNSKTTGSCTKPPEFEDDPGYLGRLAPKIKKSDVESIGDLIDSDLFYIGDGVRLPLTIKKLKDGSFALSISDKICKERSDKKCPCCVPRDGKILQESRSVKSDNEDEKLETNSSLHRRAIREDENMSEKIHHQHRKRETRSISMPVDEFVEKYNLILNLNDERQEFSAEFPSLKNDKEGDSLMVESLKSLNDDGPDNEKASILMSALQELSKKETTEVYGVINGMKKKLEGDTNWRNNEEEDRFKFEKARYGYQRDNPILDRIKIIKQLQRETTKKCERKYQQDCDDAITQKTELLTMILNWLKDVANSSTN